MMLKHQAIIDAFKVKLQLILVASGYHTDAGLNVFCWRNTALQPEELPGIVFRDGVDSADEEFATTTGDQLYYKLPVKIDLICNDADTARQMIADCQKAINTDRTLGGLAHDIEYVGFGLISEDQDEKKIIGASGKIDIIYFTQKFKEE